MQKIIKANIQGFVFPIDEAAFQTLKQYLDQLRSAVQDTEAYDDIERRIAELFSYKLNQGAEAILMHQVEEVMAQIGEVEDLHEAENPASESASNSTRRKLYRDPYSKKIFGVCAGLAHYFGIEVTWIRLAFVLAVIAGGFGFPLYIILALVLDEANSPTQQLEMKGEEVNLKNLAKDLSRDVEEAFRKGKPQAEAWMRHQGSRLGRFLGGVLLIALLVAFVPVSVGVIASAGALSFTYGLIQDYFFVDGTQAVWAFVSAAVLVLIPVISLFYVALRLLVNGRRLPLWVKTVKAVMVLMAFSYLMVLTAQVGRDFSNVSEWDQEITCNGATSEQALKIRVSGVKPKAFREHHLHLDVDGRKVDYYGESDWNELLANKLSEDVSLKLAATQDSLPYVRITRSARGKSRAAAMERAAMIEYPIEIKNNELQLSQQFGLGSESGAVWRKQEVEVTVFIPSGYKVVLDPSCRRLIHHFNGQYLNWQDWESNPSIIESKEGKLELINVD